MRYVLIFLTSVMLSISNGHAKDPVRISLSMGLTGNFAKMAEVQVMGLKLWERDINSKGGLLGRPVQITIYDDKSDPAIASELYKRFIVEDKVDFVFAPYSSQITAPVAAIT